MMSQRKKLSFLVVLFVIGVAGLASFFTRLVIRYNELRSDTLWEWILLPDIVAMACVFTAITIYSYFRVNEKISVLISEAMETLASGILHFDKRGNLVQFNAASTVFLPDLWEDMSEGPLGTYKGFLAYVYDHSLDIQDQSRLTSDLGQMDSQSRLLFREVIEIGGRRVVLVQFYQRHSSDIIAVLTDISMMKRHIDEVASLTEENSIMIKAIESAGSGMAIAEASDSFSRVIFANEVFMHMLRFNSAEIITRPLDQILESRFDDQIDIIKQGIQVARREGKAESIWLKSRPNKKEVIWYALHILFFIDANDKEFFVCFLSDQTDARLAQAKVYQSQKLEAVAQLAGGVAHDFNNILSVVDGYTKLMERGIARGDDILPFFDNIHRSVKRGSQITSRLLTFGQCRVKQKTRMDICEQVRDLESFLIPMVNYSINSILSIQDEACYIDSSPDAITQIVTSLVANARDAMPEGGDLIVSVSEASRAQILSFQEKIDPNQSYVCLQVIDSGTGIDPEILSKIYEPFFTTKDPAKNSGLGLSLVYGLVKEIEAIIDVKSTIGVGTSASILIPVKAAPPNKNFIEEEVVEDYSYLSGKTILIVDDSPDVQQMEFDLLTQLGLNVLKACNAQEVFAIHENYKEAIGFLLIDVTLPEMNGIEVSKIFSNKRPDTKIILISAYPALASVGEKISHAAFLRDHTVLAKPFVYECLENVLMQASLEGNEIGLSRKKDYWAHHEKTL